jgi:hypothetical protein
LQVDRALGGVEVDEGIFVWDEFLLRHFPRI